MIELFRLLLVFQHLIYMYSKLYANNWGHLIAVHIGILSQIKGPERLLGVNKCLDDQSRIAGILLYANIRNIAGRNLVSELKILI